MQLNWTIDQVTQDLNPLFSGNNQPSEAQQAYCGYYGIDFENQLEGLGHELGHFSAAGFTLAAHIYRHPNAKGTLLLLHGYYDHVGIYGSAIEFALKHQLNVFTYDLPGHGLSSGERASISCFQQYDEVFSAALKLAQDQFPGPLHVMGQSTGCAVISNYLLTRGIQQNESPFQQVIFLAPLIRPHQWWQARIVHSLLKPFLSGIKRTFAVNSKDPEFLRFLAEEDPLQPLRLSVAWVGALKKWVPMIESATPVDIRLTVIQGTCDGTVDWQHNMKVIQKQYPQAKIHKLEGGHHQLVNEDKQTQEELYACLSPLFA